MLKGQHPARRPHAAGQFHSSESRPGSQVEHVMTGTQASPIPGGFHLGLPKHVLLSQAIGFGSVGAQDVIR